MTATDLVSDLLEKANANRASTTQRIEAIRASRELTHEAQRDRIAEAFTTHRQQLGEIQAEVEERIVGENRRLEHKLWGNPSPSDTSAAGWRAALDRTEMVANADEAIDLLARAERSQDTLLARAVALRAIGRWPAVMGRYAKEHPEVANALTELDAFVQETDRRSRWRTAMKIALTPSMPSELRGTTSGQLHLAGTNMSVVSDVGSH